MLLVNADRPDSQLLGLGYYAESVLESSHHSLKDVLAHFHSVNKLIRAVIEFNAQSIGYFAEKSSNKATIPLHRFVNESNTFLLSHLISHTNSNIVLSF